MKEYGVKRPIWSRWRTVTTIKRKKAEKYIAYFETEFKAKEYKKALTKALKMEKVKFRIIIK